MDDLVVRWLMAEPGQPELLTLDDLIRRPAWQADAACRGMGTDVFFPTRGQPTTEARKICATCPVVAECGAYAMADPDLVGVWGGTSERARSQTRAERRQGRAA